MEMLEMATKLTKESMPQPKPGGGSAPAHPPPVRVVVVEDDSSLRRTMITFINRSPGFPCAGAFADGESALAEIPGIKPDVVLMDIGLPGMTGIECVSALKALMPAT